MDTQKAYGWIRLYETNKVNAEDLSGELNLSKRQVYALEILKIIDCELEFYALNLLNN